MLKFAAALPRLRRRVQRDLAAPGICRSKVLASIVRLLELTLIRVGNEEYARTNGSFGLTTFRNHHAQVQGENIRFHFRGKSGKFHTVSITAPRVARIVKKCQELPGHELFVYINEKGETQEINSEDVNGYLHEVMGENFTAKDFRTWAGTLLASEFLKNCGRGQSAKSQSFVKQIVKTVAAKLGNTPAVCRKSYIHPVVLELAGQKRGAGLVPGSRSKLAAKYRGLHVQEEALVALLTCQSKQR
jgi:DNA topoisomerase-1